MLSSVARLRVKLQRREGLVVMVAVALVLLSLAYWRTISTYRAPYRILPDLPAPAWIEELYVYRWLVRGTMLAAVAALVASEALCRSVTRRLRAVLSRAGTALGLVLGLTIVGRSYLLTPGRLTLGDAIANVANAMAIRVAWEEGNSLPFFWSNYAHLGFPWLQFHNSIYYYQGATLDLFIHDAYWSAKLALLLNHLLASAVMYFYVRFLTRSAWAGLVSATVWATAFFHYHFFVHVGSVHISSLIPFMPASLLCLEAILAHRRTALALAGLSLSVSMMLWAHAFYALVATAFICLYVAVRVSVSRLREGGVRERLNRLGLVGAGIALGMVAAMTQWLPPFVEK